MTKRDWKKLTRWIALPIGLTIFIIGIFLFLLPIPLGLIFMVVGLCIAAINPLVARRIKSARRRYPKADAKIRRAHPHMPRFIQKVLRRTDGRDRKPIPKPELTAVPDEILAQRESQAKK